MTTSFRTLSPKEQLGQLFGSYKAEWLKERMFDLFTEPSYFPELTASQPCILIGGRGTGKTTVLRCLSYEGQFAIRGQRSEDVPNWEFYGFYHRINTNRVTAFRGPEIDEERWIAVFAHYLNLSLSDLVLRFLQWYQAQCPDKPELERDACNAIASTLHLADCSSARDLGKQIAASRRRFEAYVNNIADGQPVPLSMQGAPIDALFEQLSTLPQFRGKDFFFLLDEYENFLDYQQRITNTLLKHSGERYTFKIGVKELGLRCRTTLNANEQLMSPADYVRINIADKLHGKQFAAFAKSVCNGRLARLSTGSPNGHISNVTVLLPTLSDDEEAELLDTNGGLLRQASDRLAAEVSDDAQSSFNTLSLLDRYLIVFWAKSQHLELRDVWQDYLARPEEWNDRFTNYKHAMLYTLRRGKRGIRKYYAGWDVFVQLAAGNIRYLLELLVQSMIDHLDSDAPFSAPIAWRLQTQAAQQVGKKNLSDLEGLAVHGASLTKLLLGLGRIFGVLASQVVGHTPEVTHFHLKENDEEADESDVDALLRSAVMHLALLRATGSKLVSETDTRDYDYMIHPIFSAFFVFSHRRKRKMRLAPHDLLELIKHPKRTIRRILTAQHRSLDEQLPDQLMLFEAYYDADT